MLAGAPVIASENLDAKQNEKNQFQVLSYQHSVGANLDYQVSVFHRYTDVTYHPDPVGDLIYNGIAAQILRRNETAGVQADASYRLGDLHTLRTGFFASRERFGVDNTSQVFAADDSGAQTSDVPMTIVDNSHITGRLFGVYLQDEWTPWKALTVNYGVRFDRVNTVVNETQVSPRLGLVYDLTSNTRVHAGYARYFTPPPTEKIDTTTIARFLGTTNALPSDANTAVKSERSNYYDAGISHQLTPQITIGVDAYLRDVRHLQDEGQFGNALIFSAFNYEKGRIYGTELSATYRDRGFTGYANASYSVAKGKGIETGQFHFGDDELAYIAQNWVHLDHDQRLAASAGASYKWGRTTLSADALYGSGLRRGFANTEHVPGYTQVNLGLAQALDLPGAGKITGRLAVVNVFDKTYELRDGSGIGVGAPQFGPRRAFYAGVGKTF
jgi:outer membrane receptor protein involved in Fe transport